MYDVNHIVLDTRNPSEKQKFTVEPDQARALLERLSSSKTLHRSPRLRDLLVDIGERSIAGRSDELSEHAIGVRVFGRSEGYSSTEDNIVRASVRQLRLKLQEYFATEGEGEELLLEIPKGGYIATFAPRTPSPSEPAGPEPPLKKTRWRYWALLAAIALAVLAYATYRTSGSHVGRPVLTPTFFSELLSRNDGPVRFVLTDSTLVIMGRLRGSRPTLDEYTSGEYARKEIPGFDPGVRDFFTRRQITSLADVSILARIYRESAEAPKRVEVRYARYMQTRDFKAGNFVISGSPNSNPWTALFDSGLNFQFEMYPIRLRNLKPVGSEPSLFEATESGPDYARIALVPNLSGDGFVVLIGGLEAEGTEGAGEFLLRSDSLTKVRRALGLGAHDAIPSCELILAIKTRQSAAQSEEIIAARRH